MGNYFIGYGVGEALWHGITSPPPGEGLWWVHPDDLHLTIAFLGSIPEERARTCFQWVCEQELSPLRGTLGPAIPLGSRPPASAFARPLEEGFESAVENLQRLGPPLLACAGRPPETRAPLPHITILRARNSTSPAVRQQAEEWLRKRTQGRVSIHLSQIGLYGWAVDRTERRYRLLDSVQLPNRITG